MKQCEVCGNDYENIFEIKFAGDHTSHWFDCFECAAHQLAPECKHCGVKILGHGVQGGNELFCGAHCARSHGYKGISDRTESMVAQ